MYYDLIEEAIFHYRELNTKPTHLLLTEDQHVSLMREAGIPVNDGTKLLNLFDLKIIYSQVPLETPRVLSIFET